MFIFTIDNQNVGKKNIYNSVQSTTVSKWMFSWKSPVIFAVKNWKLPVIKTAMRWSSKFTCDCQESPVILWNILIFLKITSWSQKITSDFYSITCDFERSLVTSKNHRWFCSKRQKLQVIFQNRFTSKNYNSRTIFVNFNKITGAFCRFQQDHQ